MMRFCSVHTHSICCDGKNTLTEMARAAYAQAVLHSVHDLIGIFQHPCLIYINLGIHYPPEPLVVRIQIISHLPLLLRVTQALFKEPLREPCFSIIRYRK